MKIPRTSLPKREHWHEETVEIEIDPNFKDGIDAVLNELNAIYRFENNKLVLYESEFKRFMGFMKPVIEFCDTLKEKVKDDTRRNQ